MCNLNCGLICRRKRTILPWCQLSGSFRKIKQFAPDASCPLSVIPSAWRLGFLAKILDNLLAKILNFFPRSWKILPNLANFAKIICKQFQKTENFSGKKTKKLKYPLAATDFEELDGIYYFPPYFSMRGILSSHCVHFLRILANCTTARFQIWNFFITGL